MHSFIFPKIPNFREVFPKMKSPESGQAFMRKEKSFYSEAELSQISDYSNKCLSFLPHFLGRDSGLRNKVTELRSLIISAFKMTQWLCGSA